MTPVSRRGGARIRRGAGAVALLVLGALAADRLPLGLASRVTYPRLGVSLTLPGTADPVEVARLHAAPLEASIRGLGQVRRLSGEVTSTGVELDVRLEPGTDPERKAARLAADLERLRRDLPEGSRLGVWPAVSEERNAAFLALTGPAPEVRAEAVADVLRGIAGVADVTVYGGLADEQRVALTSRVEAGAVRRELERSLAAPFLGEATAGRRRVPLVAAPIGGTLSALRVRAGRELVSLGTVATITRGPAERTSLARAGGARAVVLALTLERGASLLRVDAALRRVAPAHALVFLERAAGPLRRILATLGGGLALAAAALALGGFLVAGGGAAFFLSASVPLGTSAALLALWIGGSSLDGATLPAVALGIAAGTAAGALRLLSRGSAGTGFILLSAAAAALLPVAVALGSGTLAPVLSAPARAFALAAPAAAAASLLLPRPTRGRPRGARAGRALREVLRDAPTVLLAATTGGWALLTLFGAALDPRGPDRSEPERLVLLTRLPEGTTLAQTEAFVTSLESRAARLGGLRDVWSWVVPGRAQTVLTVEPGAGAALLPTRLRSIAGSFVTVDVEEARRDVLEDEDDDADPPRTDREATTYRAILKSPDAESLAVAATHGLDRLVATGLASGQVRLGWGPPSLHVELAPRPGTAPAEARTLAAALRERSVPPVPLTLSSRPRRLLTVVPAGAPVRGTDVPQRRSLLDEPLATAGGPVVLSARLAPLERLVRPALRRSSFRFVLSIEVRFTDFGEDARRDKREKADRALGVTPLPEGCDLVRPDLSRLHLTPERRRLLLLSGTLPLLLFVLAAFRLDSIGLGAAALIPGFLGVAATTPFLAAGGRGTDASTLLALGAALAGTLPVTLHVLARLHASPGSRAYRPARELTPALGLSALAFATPLLPAGLAGGRLVAMPLVAGAVAGAVSIFTAAAVLPALVAGTRALRRVDAAERARRRRPTAWVEPMGPPSLSVRSLTKRYGSVRALTDVSFELGPGVTGLLGPNGAGKTTLLRLLTGLLTPTRGQIRFRGVLLTPDGLPEYRRSIGTLPQEFNAYPELTAEQFLDYWALERGLDDRRARAREVESLLVTVGLADDARRKVRDYSGGMRQRIGIARALLGSPPILVVDEPTTGLDLESRDVLRELLVSIGRERIVLLSTHLAGDVERAAGRILLVVGGRIRFDGSPETLLSRARGRVFTAVLPDEALREAGRLHRITARVRVPTGIRVRGVARAGEPLAGEAVEPTLEEAYLAAATEEPPASP